MGKATVSKKKKNNIRLRVGPTEMQRNVAKHTKYTASSHIGQPKATCGYVTDEMCWTTHPWNFTFGGTRGHCRHNGTESTTTRTACPEQTLEAKSNAFSLSRSLRIDDPQSSGVTGLASRSSSDRAWWEVSMIATCRTPPPSHGAEEAIELIVRVLKAHSSDVGLIR